MSDAQGAAGHDAGPPDAMSALAWELIRHVRLVHQTKQRVFANEALDVGALGLLLHLTECGPSRQNELADASRLDPSTVSRHVSQLVKAGLVERRPDPEDGRAVQLAPTEAGLERLAAAKRRRVALVADAIQGWSEDDVAQLTRLVTQLNDDLEKFHRTENP